MDMKKTILASLALLGMSCALAAVNINTAGADELKTLPGIGSVNRADQPWALLSSWLADGEEA